MLTLEQAVNLKPGDRVYAFNAMAQGYTFTEYEVFTPEVFQGRTIMGHKRLQYIRQVKNRFAVSYIFDAHLNQFFLEVPEGGILV